ncbi:MAG: acetate--CoA ligase family protein [Candidatus Marsarchaeota archaeon]|nr:acetate--CoA ligase family protein [Candidatus Marsarchaeota archaeon]
MDFSKTEDLLIKHDFPLIQSAKGACFKSLAREVEKKQIKPPFFLKGYGKEIIHKTDFGLVQQIEKMEEFERKFNVMRKNRKVETFVAQEKKEGIEFMIGALNDPIFGKVILFGLGGVGVELYNDVSLRIAPLNKELVKSMVFETKAGVFFKGFRGLKLNYEKMEELLLKTEKVFTFLNFKSLDFNPVILGKDGPSIVDFRVV